MNGCCLIAVTGIALGAIGVAVTVIIYVATQTKEFPKINRRIDRLSKRINNLETQEQKIEGDSYEEYRKYTRSQPS